MIGFLNPWALLGLALLPLYALWFRRPTAARETPDATVFLWQAAARQQPPRRLKVPWRLVLHLAILTALIMTAARPHAQTPSPPIAAVLLNLNLSMNATDGATTQAAEMLGLTGPVTRFAVAEAVALDLRSNHGTIRLYDSASVAPLSDELRTQDEVKDAFARLQPNIRSDTAAMPDPAQLAELSAAANTYWLSDRPPPTGANVKAYNLAGLGRNVGIVATQGDTNGVWFNLISTYLTPQSVTITAYPVTPSGTANREAAALGRTRVTVPAGGQATGRLERLTTGPVALILTPPSGDALALDDLAFADPRPISVRLDRSNPRLQRALNATGRADVGISQAAGRQPAELRILHGRLADLGSGVVLRLPPPAADVAVGTGLPHVSRDPLVDGLIFSGVRLALTTPTASPASGGRSDTLVRAQQADGTLQPLLTRTQRPQGDIIDLYATLGRGDLTNRAVFPAFISRLVREAETQRQQPLGTQTADDNGRLVPRVQREDGLTIMRHLVHPSTTRLPGPDAFTPTRELLEQASRFEDQDLTPWPLVAALLLLMTEAGLRFRDALHARRLSA